MSQLNRRPDRSEGEVGLPLLPHRTAHSLRTPYTWFMPTPVGPVPPGPDDPDTWDWGEFPDRGYGRKPLWQVALVGIVVLGLVLLLVVNIL